MEHLCECGCGGTPSIAPQTNRKRGYVKGLPVRFIYQHWMGRFIKHGLATAHDKRYYMWKGSRRRAVAKGIPWDLCLDDIPPIPDICPALGITLDRTSTKTNDYSPSLDCVIPELGYVPGNVRVISWRANRIKSNATSRELILLVSYIQEHISHEQNS